MYIKNHNMQATAMPTAESDAQLHLRIWHIRSAVPRPHPEELCPSKFRLEDTSLSPILELECGPLIKDLARSLHLTRSGIKTSGNSRQSLGSADFLEEVSSEISWEWQENQQREMASVPGVLVNKSGGRGHTLLGGMPMGVMAHLAIPAPESSQFWGTTPHSYPGLHVEVLWDEQCATFAKLCGQGHRGQPHAQSTCFAGRQPASSLLHYISLMGALQASISVSMFTGCGFGDSFYLPISLMCSLCP